MAWPGEETQDETAASRKSGLPLSVVMVCTGNICRSPLAEQLLTAEAHRLSLPLTVSSAGTHAMLGGSIPAEIEDFLAAAGTPPTAHAPRQLTTEIILGADIVLTATREHRKFVVSMAPRSATSTFTLNQFVRLLEGHAELVAAGKLPPASSARGLIQALADVRGLVLPADRPEDDDIADPYRGTLADYDLAGSQILRGVTAISSALSQL